MLVNEVLAFKNKFEQIVGRKPTKQELNNCIQELRTNYEIYEYDFAINLVGTNYAYVVFKEKLVLSEDEFNAYHEKRKKEILQKEILYGKEPYNHRKVNESHNVKSSRYK